MKQKLDIQLGNIQETLLLPLSARAYETSKPKGIIQDSKSLELVKQLRYDYKKMARNMSDFGVYALAIRALKFDRYINDFQKKFPNGKILTIGAGLDTYYYRVDNGTSLWYDLDLHDTMELRKQLLPTPNSRVQYIAKSMFDISWIDDIGSTENGLLILIPGVLPYFNEEQVKDLLVEIAPKLPNTSVVFDTISQLGILLANHRIKDLGIENAPLKWGIIDTHLIEDWSEHIETEEIQTFFDQYSDNKEIQFFTRLLMKMNDFLSASQIVKIKFI